jgi:hypothetical protein
MLFSAFIFFCCIRSFWKAKSFFMLLLSGNEVEYELSDASIVTRELDLPYNVVLLGKGHERTRRYE